MRTARHLRRAAKMRTKVPRKRVRLPDREAVLRAIDARKGGATLREAAGAAGVHVATLCRWQLRFPGIREALLTAVETGALIRVQEWLATWRPTLPVRKRRRPRVRWHHECPWCGNGVVVKSVVLWVPVAFWRCERWPRCEWASWLPRHPEDCPLCGGPRFWSHSRRSVSCSRCRARWPAAC